MVNSRGVFFVAAVAVLMVSCGDHSSEGNGARKLGAAPKQVVDKATDDVEKALKQGADRSREADEGKN